MRLNEYDRFPNRALYEEGNMIEEAMIVESEPIDFISPLKRCSLGV